MDTPAQPLVPIDKDTSTNDVVKVNDTVNRTGRTTQNVLSVGVVVGIINNRTGLDLSAEEALVVMAILTSVVTFLRNLAEYHNWIPSTKKAGAEIAPPRNEDGQQLAVAKP